tara:strand:+ start:198 stop:581 length:384 start_codon:yes stop_codon:yes gene_type:complete
MAEEIVQTSNELNDASKDRDVVSNTERDRDLSVTNISQDVDTQELIRSNNQSFAAQIRAEDLADRVQARRHAEEQHGQRMRLQMQLDAQAVRDRGNAGTHTEQLNQQTVRHTDHTLIDLHNAADPDA